MSPLRRVVARVVGAWLVCQLAALTAAPIALAYAPAIASALPACCRAGSGSHACPMHKGGAATCSMRAACSTGDMALVSLFGVTGVLPDSASAATLTRPATPTLIAAAAPRTHSDRPDAPPPRA